MEQKEYAVAAMPDEFAYIADKLGELNYMLRAGASDTEILMMRRHRFHAFAAFVLWNEEHQGYMLRIPGRFDVWENGFCDYR